LDKKQQHSLFHFDIMVEDHILLNIAAKTNQNLLGPQRELLVWHWRMAHIGFNWLQQLMKAK
jgi:hypothetical protein